MRTAFLRLGFQEAVVDDLLPPGGDTFFVIAGVQLFDDVLRRGAPPPDGAFFVPQPCVRLRSLAKVGRKPGIVSSFVNLCTEQMNASFSEYLQHLESWTKALVKAGLDEDGLTLIVEEEVRRRGDLEFRTVNVNYFGFELGEGILLSSVDADSPAQTIVDCGFGFERIVWAVNEADSFYSLIGPTHFALSGDPRIVDALRTMTLLIRAGLTPANSGRGYVLRRLGKLAAEVGVAGAPLDSVVDHSYRYWEEFTAARVDLDTCRNLITAEIHRAMNSVLAGTLGLRVAGERLDLTPDAFVVDLVRRNRISLGALRDALNVG